MRVAGMALPLRGGIGILPAAVINIDGFRLETMGITGQPLSERPGCELAVPVLRSWSIDRGGSSRLPARNS